MGLSSDGMEFEFLVRKGFYDQAREKLEHLTLCKDELKLYHTYWKRQSERLNHLEYRLMMRDKANILRIAFLDFWPSFNPLSSEFFNFFLSIIGQLRPIQICKASEHPDILFASCFGNEINTTNASNSATRILMLGENVLPCYTQYDYSISMNEDHYSGRNIYLPLWMQRLDLFTRNSRLDYVPISSQCICSAKYLDPRPLSVACIANNWTPERANIVSHLIRNGVSVDLYGSSFKPVPDKKALLLEYSHSLCLENSYHPGYVTEKAFDSFMAGCIPIYYGANSTICPINLESVVDYDEVMNNDCPQSFLYLRRHQSTQMSALLSLNHLNSLVSTVTKQLLEIVSSLYPFS